jgi:hypothetical protein
MNESTWIQSNWYELGNLLAQFTFLAAGIWFARKILRTMRASQEQVGALLKLSVTGSVAERPSSSVLAERTLGGASPYWLTPPEIPPVSVPQPRLDSPSRWTVGWHKLLVWLQTPMSTGEVAPWRRVVRWLQAPARS